MLKKILYVAFGVPIALIVGFAIMSFVSAFLGGDASLIEWILQHKILLGLGIAAGIYVMMNPFKKK